MADEGFELYASTMSGTRADRRHRGDHPANRANTPEQQVRDRRQFLINGANSLGETIKTMKEHLDKITEIDPKAGESEKVNLIAFLRSTFEFLDPSLGAAVNAAPPQREAPKKHPTKRPTTKGTKASD